MNNEQKYLIQIIRTVLNPEGMPKPKPKYEQSSSQEISGVADRFLGKADKKNHPDGSKKQSEFASASSAPSENNPTLNTQNSTSNSLCASAPLREIETVDIDKLFAISTAQGVAGLVAKAMTTSHPTPHTSLLNSNLQKKFEFLASLATQEDDYKKKEEALRSLVEYISTPQVQSSSSLSSSSGIGLILLKGISLSQYWPIPNHRPCGDIDILPVSNVSNVNGVTTFSTCSQEVDKLIENLRIEVHDKINAKHSWFEWQGVKVENHHALAGLIKRGGAIEKNRLLMQSIEKQGLRSLNLDNEGKLFSNCSSIEFDVQETLNNRDVEYESECSHSKTHTQEPDISKADSNEDRCSRKNTTTFWTLSPVTNFAFLIRSAINDIVYNPNHLTLRHLVDITFFLDSNRDMDINAAQELITDMHLQSATTLILHLCQYVTGIDLTPFCEEIGESGNKGTRDSGNKGTRDSGNKGTRDSGNKGIRESKNSHLTSHISHPSQNVVLTPDESRVLEEILNPETSHSSGGVISKLISPLRTVSRNGWKYKYFEEKPLTVLFRNYGDLFKTITKR